VTTERRLAIVSGGAQGIGAACAHALAAEGVGIVIADLNADRADETAKQIETAHRVSARAQQLDIAQPGDCSALLEALTRQGEQPSILVNCATLYREAPALDQDQLSGRL
jgi:3-oxoacyl-[acyl-carrier protein] reductase